MTTNGCDVLPVILGETDNLAWELCEIVSRNAARKLLLVVPLYASAERLWGRFRETYARTESTPLPEEISEDALVMRFDADWNPSVYVTRGRGGDDYAVSLGHAVSDIKKGRFTKGYVRARHPLRVISLVAATVGFLAGGLTSFVSIALFIMAFTEGKPGSPWGWAKVILLSGTFAGAVTGACLGYRVKRL